MEENINYEVLMKYIRKENKTYLPKALAFDVYIKAISEQANENKLEKELK